MTQINSDDNSRVGDFAVTFVLPSGAAMVFRWRYESQHALRDHLRRLLARDHPFEVPSSPVSDNLDQPLVYHLIHPGPGVYVQIMPWEHHESQQRQAQMAQMLAGGKS